MKAVTITAAGGPEVLQVAEVQTPPLPTADRVRVRVRAAGLIVPTFISAAAFIRLLQVIRRTSPALSLPAK